MLCAARRVRQRLTHLLPPPPAPPIAIPARARPLLPSVRLLQRAQLELNAWRAARVAAARADAQSGAAAGAALSPAAPAPQSTAPAPVPANAPAPAPARFSLPAADAAALQASAGRAARLWLRWLRRAVPSSAERAQPLLRPQVATVFSLLSQIFGVLGRFRHAATAAQVALFHHGPERAGAAQASAGASASAR